MGSLDRKLAESEERQPLQLTFHLRLIPPGNLPAPPPMQCSRDSQGTGRTLVANWQDFPYSSTCAGLTLYRLK